MVGIIEFIKRKFALLRRNKEVKEEIIEESIEEIKEEVPVSKPQINYVPDLSMLELEEFDNWEKFGGLLKRDLLLPNSYDKKPVKVNVTYDGNSGRAQVELTFKSKTSDSVREYVLTQDEVLEYVNGKLNENAFENADLKYSWTGVNSEGLKGYGFMDYVRMHNELKQKEDVRHHREKGEELRKQANKMMRLEEFFKKENKFLVEHSDDVYIAFNESEVEGKEPVCFVAASNLKTIQEANKKPGHIAGKRKVYPFSPKTLEHCVLRLIEVEKLNEAKNIDEFLRKCNKLKKNSVYESKDWDKTIAMLCMALKEEEKFYENIR